MKKPSRFLRLLGTASLLATLLAGVFATSITYAGDPDPDPADDGAVGDIWDGTEPALLGNQGGLYFPWVGNDDESTGLGPADTSVSIMNISADPAIAFAWVGSHDTEELPDTGGWDIVGPFFLAPWASKTFTAAQLGIAEGAGAPVAFAGYNALYAEGGVCETVLGGPLEPGNDVNGNGECTDVEVLISGDDPEEPYICEVDDANGDPAPTVGDDGLNADGDCIDAEQGPTGGTTVAIPTTLGGYAKQAVDGENLPYTSSADSSVSGYNALGGFELGEFDDWYFPIVQTNGGPGGAWNSIIRIANFGQVVDGEVGNIGSAAVTARFFPADDAQGSLDTGFQLQGLLNTGDVWTIDVSDYVPEGWVGSVHVYSDSAIFAMVDRVKLGYSAWITNTASNAPYTNANNVEASSSGNYVLFAPDVRFDFFGWNTGINIANLVNDDNNVNVQYFNAFGNAPEVLSRRLAAQGMTYFYDPSIAAQDGSVQDPGSDVNADIIGSALIWSEYPVAVAVDATKYPESTTSDDPNIFQAMSYSATGNVYTTQAFPLVQKGNPTTGMGATSGINIMNPNANAAQATVYWVNPSGFGATNFGQSAVAIPGFANGFVYTMTQGNLPNGFYGSAVLTSTLPVSAVTTQVDYQVEWDGTAVWLGYNPCGYYRDNGWDGGEFPSDWDCNFGDPFNPQGGQITKIVQDELGDPVVGAYFTLMNEAYYQQSYLGNESFLGSPWVAGGYSNVNGEIEWTNVPVGTYYLEITSVPTTDDNDMGDDELDQYDGAGTVEGPFTLDEGEDIVIENELDRVLATKYVLLGDDAEGLEVCLHADDDGDGDLSDDEVASYEDCDVADEDGEVVFDDVEPGTYWISVNQGLEFDQVAGFVPAVFGPETFVLGGVYVNDLSGDVNPAEGNLQKVLVLPASICGVDLQPALAGEAEGVACPDVTISGLISFYGPDGELEVEGNVQTQFLDFIGPNDEPAFSLTDFNVPVGGPYTIEEYLEITYDLDGPGGDDPVTVVIDRTGEDALTTAEDGQVVCEDYLDASSDCEASPTDPEIYVFEDMTTRVFNDFTDIVEGQIDLFVRDEETEEPLSGALACLYDEDAGEILACDLTDVDGQAEFPGVGAGFYSLTVGHPDYELQGSGTFFYVPEFDSFLGGGMNDELGDIDPFLGQQDILMALDPTGATILVILDGPTELAGGGELEGVQVGVYERGVPPESDITNVEPADVCSGAQVGLLTTDADGEVEFGVNSDTEYCVYAFGDDGQQTPIMGFGDAELAGPIAPGDTETVNLTYWTDLAGE